MLLAGGTAAVEQQKYRELPLLCSMGSVRLEALLWSILHILFHARNVYFLLQAH